MIKVRTLFSGIGAPEKSLNSIKIPYELINFCEVDKYAIKSYCAVHGVDPSKNLGDISQIDISKIKYADLQVWGFPCQDISIAGNMKGIQEGTRSGLYHQGFEILKKTKPKYSIIENVKNLISKRFKSDFENMLKDIEDIGYNNYWKVLNAKDYGIPQNRERVFIVSIRKDIDNGTFKFPIAFDNGLRLKDFLEDSVAEKFYIDRPWHISTELDQKHDANEIAQLEGIKYKATRSITDINKICRCIDTMGGGQREPKVLVKEATKKGYAEANEGDSINIEQPNSKTRRGRVGKQRINTLTCSCNQAVVTKNRIRKLTPKECWRLMGFDDTDFEKAKAAGISNTQLYRQAGNSIVTNVLSRILTNLLKE